MIGLGLITGFTMQRTLCTYPKEGKVPGHSTKASAALMKAKKKKEKRKEKRKEKYK